MTVGEAKERGIHTWRAVAVQFEESRIVCRRCGVELEGWHITHEHSLQGLTLNDYRYRQLEKDGILYD